MEKIIGRLIPITTVVTKLTNAAIRAANEEYRVKNATNSQTVIAKKPIVNSKANRIPAEVATPFPPLNLKKMGNKCPRKTNTAETPISTFGS